MVWWERFGRAAETAEMFCANTEVRKWRERDNIWQGRRHPEADSVAADCVEAEVFGYSGYARRDV